MGIFNQAVSGLYMEKLKNIALFEAIKDNEAAIKRVIEIKLSAEVSQGRLHNQGRRDGRRALHPPRRRR